ncbi:class I SAM-dependent methyltransferase [Clostridium sp. C8-1-8]|uniref:class I SAM-dependent methyltransferase n=1 Tax=Clostridium sp. C8-1-8 TaxID=2698831 RepID=UPI00136D6DB9|nr:class I SAM-dependent methyltransferase [Clostridium sp. C8-1-8]
MVKDLCLDVICNPSTHNKLIIDSNGIEEFLVDSRTGERFAIKEGIPSFIRSEDIDGTNYDSTKFYNSFAPFYELGQKAYYAFLGGEEKARKDYLQFIDVREGDKVLEVSVGTGANIKFLPRNAEYYGLDISLGQLKQCEKNNKKYDLGIKLFWGNGEMLPFADDSFDVVYHIGGINFFNDKKRAIGEMVRVAKSGSKLLIADETEKVAKFFEKIPYFRGPFKNIKEAITAPVDLLPENVRDVKVTEIRNGTLYCLEFIKI